jgi:TRAP-type C4-dicarboxylate transport system permease small subunit
MMPGPGWIHAISAALVWLVNRIVVALASVMLLAIGWQVVMRYLFNRPPSWTEELALLCFTWCSLLMLALGVRQAFHARIDLIVNHLPGPLARGLERLTQLMVGGFGAFLLLGGSRYVLETATSLSAAIAYPIYWLHGAAPACGFLVLWFSIEQLLCPPVTTSEELTS